MFLKTEQTYLLLPMVCNIVLEALTNAIKCDKVRKLYKYILYFIYILYIYYIKYENITINGRQNCDYKKSKRMYNRWLVLIRNSVRSLNMGSIFF